MIKAVNMRMLLHANNSRRPRRSEKYMATKMKMSLGGWRAGAVEV
jgi:hypothetical protein